MTALTAFAISAMLLIIVAIIAIVLFIAYELSSHHRCIGSNFGGRSIILGCLII